jgi:hypothetical protein
MFDCDAARRSAQELPSACRTGGGEADPRKPSFNWPRAVAGALIAAPRRAP